LSGAVHVVKEERYIYIRISNRAIVTKISFLTIVLCISKDASGYLLVFLGSVDLPFSSFFSPKLTIWYAIIIRSIKFRLTQWPKKSWDLHPYASVTILSPHLWQILVMKYLLSLHTMVFVPQTFFLSQLPN